MLPWIKTSEYNSQRCAIRCAVDMFEVNEAWSMKNSIFVLQWQWSFSCSVLLYGIIVMGILSILCFTCLGCNHEDVLLFCRYVGSPDGNLWRSGLRSSLLNSSKKVRFQFHKSKHYICWPPLKILLLTTMISKTRHVMRSWHKSRWVFNASHDQRGITNID